MKTSELTGAALDWAVAKCEGDEPQIERGVVWGRPFHGSFSRYCPTTDWAQGGPIIERYGIDVVYRAASNMWLAYRPEARGVRSSVTSTGPTPLIAVMRCYVASELGDEVEVPNELQGEKA